MAFLTSVIPCPVFWKFSSTCLPVYSLLQSPTSLTVSFSLIALSVKPASAVSGLNVDPGTTNPWVE